MRQQNANGYEELLLLKLKNPVGLAKISALPIGDESSVQFSNGDEISGYFSYRGPLFGQSFQWVGCPTRSVIRGCILSLKENFCTYRNIFSSLHFIRLLNTETKIKARRHQMFFYVSTMPGGGTWAKMGTGTCRWVGALFQPL